MHLFSGGLSLSPLPPSTRLPKVPGAPLVPLSPSSGGLAGRSDRERGGRPPCTARSLGLPPGFGGMPQPSFTSASLGGAGRRQAPLPLRRPWRVAARAGSGPSSRNNPDRLGSKFQICGPALPSRARRGSGNGGVSLDPFPSGLDLEPPVAGGSSADGGCCGRRPSPLFLTKVVGVGGGVLCFSSSAPQCPCCSPSYRPAMAARGAG
jgi:hypothetical protein